jgi:hypothetical protein
MVAGIWKATLAAVFVSSYPACHRLAVACRMTAAHEPELAVLVEGVAAGGEAEDVAEASGTVVVAGATLPACLSRSSRGASVRLEQPMIPLANKTATHSPRKLRDSFMRPFRVGASSQATRIRRL